MNDDLSGNQFNVVIKRLMIEGMPDFGLAEPVNISVTPARPESKLAAKVFLLIERTELGKQDIIRQLECQSASGALHKQTTVCWVRVFWP